MSTIAFGTAEDVVDLDDLDTVSASQRSLVRAWEQVSKLFIELLHSNEALDELV